MVVCNNGHPLLILPDQIRDIPHRHGKKRPSGNGTKGEGCRAAQETAAITGDDGSSHSSNDDIDSTGEQFLAGFGGGSQGSDGVGEGVFDVQGAGEDIIEGDLGGTRLLVEEETALTDLGG
jgi:hypothetical protein